MILFDSGRICTLFKLYHVNSKGPLKVRALVDWHTMRGNRKMLDMLNDLPFHNRYHIHLLFMLSAMCKCPISLAETSRRTISCGNSGDTGDQKWFALSPRRRLRDVSRGDKQFARKSRGRRRDVSGSWGDVSESLITCDNVSAMSLAIAALLIREEFAYCSNYIRLIQKARWKWELWLIDIPWDLLHMDSCPQIKGEIGR